MTDQRDEPTRRDLRYQLLAVIGLFAASAAWLGVAIADPHLRLPYLILAIGFLIVGLMLALRYRRQRSS